MVLEKVQIYYIIFNVLVICLGFGLSFLAIKLLNIKEKNSKLIFWLYILYWVPVLCTRDYTGLIQLHMGLNDGGLLLWIPLVSYGFVGLLWRPLSDYLSFKFRSRKNVLFFSIILQAVCLIPMIVQPSLAANIIQSIGAGIGASCIGLFNLMFNEQDAKEQTFKVVSILAIPPILAQFIGSSVDCLITTFESPTHTAAQFVDTIWWMWVVAAFFIVVSFVLAFFIKERPNNMYLINAVKEPTKTKNDYFVVLSICIMGAIIMFIKWATGGPTASIQIAYLGNKLGTDTRAYEEYSSLISSLGQLVGVIIAGLWLNNKTTKIQTAQMWLVGISSFLIITYLVVSAQWLKIGVYIGTMPIAGIGYGMTSTVFTGAILKKYFTNKTKFTPMGLFNLFMAAGISIGSAVPSIMKAELFDQIHSFSTFSLQDFYNANWITNAICIGAAVVIVILTVSSQIVYVKYKPKLRTIKRRFSITADTEM